MSEKEFRLTTPRYFYFRQKGFEALQVEAWQRTRMAAFYSFLPHTKKHSLKKPENLFRLPGEGLPEFDEMTLAAMKEHLSKGRNVDFFKGETIKAEA